MSYNRNKRLRVSVAAISKPTEPIIIAGFELVKPFLKNVKSKREDGQRRVADEDN